MGPDETGGSRKWWVFLAIGVGTFVSALVGSAVNAVLPVIQQAFGRGGQLPPPPNQITPGSRTCSESGEAS